MCAIAISLVFRHPYNALMRTDNFISVAGTWRYFFHFFFIIFVKLELLSFHLTIPLDHSIKKRKGMRVRKWSKWATDCNSAQFASPGCIACSSTIQMRPRTFLSASIEQRLIERIKKFHAWVMMKNVITKGLRTAWQSSIRKLNSGEWTKNLNSN